ncbi:MAG: hypothetical protein ABJA79_08555 [Parafilimonas sp.]
MKNTITLRFENQTCKIIVKEIFHPIHSMAHVTFEDGYENIFFSDIETGEWIEQELGYTGLARAVGTLVASNNKESIYPRQQLTWYHDTAGIKSIDFGYVKYQSGGHIFYEIFASNKRYMFTLLKNKQLWKVFSHTNLQSWNFDREFFQEVPFILDTYKL